MIKHFCDRCHKETNYKDMVRVYFLDTDNTQGPNFELCRTCSKEVAAKINNFAKEAQFFV